MIGRWRRLTADVVYTQRQTRAQKHGARERSEVYFPDGVHDLWASRTGEMRGMSGKPLRELKRDEAIIGGDRFGRNRSVLKALWEADESDVGRVWECMRRGC